MKREFLKIRLQHNRVFSSALVRTVAQVEKHWTRLVVHEVSG